MLARGCSPAASALQLAILIGRSPPCPFPSRVTPGARPPPGPASPWLTSSPHGLVCGLDVYIARLRHPHSSLFSFFLLQQEILNHNQFVVFRFPPFFIFSFPFRGLASLNIKNQKSNHYHRSKLLVNLNLNHKATNWFCSCSSTIPEFSQTLSQQPHFKFFNTATTPICRPLSSASLSASPRVSSPSTSSGPGTTTPGSSPSPRTSLASPARGRAPSASTALSSPARATGTTTSSTGTMSPTTRRSTPPSSPPPAAP